MVRTRAVRAQTLSGIRNHRLERQYRDDGARRKEFPDVRFDDIKLILEIDGREFHKSDEQVEDDYDRQVLLVDAGWTVLRLTVRQIRNDPALAVRRVQRIVERMRSEISKPAG